MSIKSEQIEISSSDFGKMKDYVYEQLVASTVDDVGGNRMRWYPWHSAEYRFTHILNVISLSTKIAQNEGANIDQVRVSALFHDIAKFSSTQKDHAKDGADLTSAYLRENFNFPDSFLENIHKIISNHVHDGSISHLSLEERCLIEADMIDKIGANGSTLLLLRMGYDSHPPAHIMETLQKVIKRGKETLPYISTDTGYSLAYQRIQRATWLKEWVEDETPGVSELPRN